MQMAVYLARGPLPPRSTGAACPRNEDYTVSDQIGFREAICRGSVEPPNDEMGNIVKLGTTNRWREMAAMTTILVLATAVIALVVLPGDDRSEAPGELKPATPVAAARQTDSVFAAATPAASDLPSGTEIFERQGVIAVSQGEAPDAEPALFRGTSAQEMPEALWVQKRDSGTTR